MADNDQGISEPVNTGPGVPQVATGVGGADGLHSGAMEPPMDLSARMASADRTDTAGGHLDDNAAEITMRPGGYDSTVYAAAEVTSADQNVSKKVSRGDAGGPAPQDAGIPKRGGGAIPTTPPRFNR